MRSHYLLSIMAIFSTELLPAQSAQPNFTCYNGIATVILGAQGSTTIRARDLIVTINQTTSLPFDASFTLNASDSTKTFSCQDVPNGRSVVLPITIYGRIGNAPPDSCSTYVLIQDNSDNACKDDFRGLIHGKVLDQMGAPMKDVVIKLEKSDKSILKDTTNEFGEYAFDHLPIDSSSSFSTLPVKGIPGFQVGYQYKIEAEDFTTDYTSQVSTIDLILLQKHIQGVAPFTNKLNYIAGDINNDLDINVLDLLELRKLILLLIDRFPNNGSYKFLPKSLYEVYNPGAPPPFNSTIRLVGPTQYDFIGVKIGDIRN
ncbi:MAG: hypothetical protein IPK94_21780 [Saprospiraceae bacterium]|nr:hypothetical protein [Saprospiraceae bacterium]MBK8282693.1 hypothetical protein [Saprospiraceae bacterium]MBK8778925.1 hypothetical protein [Saprospiraceae bacterium]MBK9677762.1 hypothetical protein [Saprospiraceae bacterium]